MRRVGLRVANALLTMLPILITIMVTYFVATKGWVTVLALFIVLDMVISALSTLLIIDYWRKSKDYESVILSRARIPDEHGKNYRVAVLIPVFNEPPSIVAETTLASKAAVWGIGDVHVLDDSTDQRIRAELDWYSKEYGFHILRRGSRKGFKAGNINSWLKSMERITTS